jgi:DNA-binding CsgD family transcriptional regulator
MPHALSAIRCVIVDDQRMVLDLLTDAVRGVPGLTVVATATDVVEADRLAAIRSRLTVREWEVFVALGEGLSNKQLAKTLGLSTRTVETHRKAIARKLGVSGAALVRDVPAAFAMTENMPMGMFVTEMRPDGARRFVFVSNRLLHMLGVERAAFSRPRVPGNWPWPARGSRLWNRR